MKNVSANRQHARPPRKDDGVAPLVEGPFGAQGGITDAEATTCLMTDPCSSGYAATG